MTNKPERPIASMSGLIFMITSVLLFLGAVGIFIWLLVDSAEARAIKNLFYGCAFLVCTLGLLLYVLCVGKAPRTSAAILWIAMVLGAASFTVGLCLKCDNQKSIVTESSITATSWQLS